MSNNNNAIRKAFNDFMKVLKANSVIAPVKKISTEKTKKKTKGKTNVSKKL
jgi:hypothetical protein